MKNKNIIQFSNCHEDVLMLKRATMLSKNPRVVKKALSLAGAGDNALSLLAMGFDEVVAFDVNPTQMALLNLKATGIKYLEYHEFLILLGLKPGDRLSMYRVIRGHLDEEAKAYFDKHQSQIKKGILKAGKYEKFFLRFQRFALPLVHHKKTVQAFLSCPTVESQRILYQASFNNRRFQSLFKFFFSRFISKSTGLKEGNYKDSKKNLARTFKDRLDAGFKDHLNSMNPYIQWLLQSKYLTMPFYLEPLNFQKIKDKIDSLKYVTGDLEKVAEEHGEFTFMNLSDMFEYVSDEVAKEYQQVIARISTYNAMICYWNMLMPRQLDERYFNRIPLAYKKYDRVFYYQAFLVYEHKGEEPSK